MSESLMDPDFRRGDDWVSFGTINPSTKMHRRSFLLTTAAAGASLMLPPLPRARPRPTPAQLKYQRAERALFLHFGVNTFTDREWGDGT